MSIQLSMNIYLSSVSLICKVSDNWIRDLEFNHRLHKKLTNVLILWLKHNCQKYILLPTFLIFKKGWENYFSISIKKINSYVIYYGLHLSLPMCEI